MKHSSSLLLVLASGALLLLGGCHRNGGPETIILNGRLEAPTVDLAPKVAGRVLEVKVHEGDRVKAGDLLVTLDLGETAVAVERDRQGLRSAEAKLRDFEVGSRPAEIDAAQADLRDKEAAVDLAHREEERQKALLAKKVGAPDDYDRAKTEFDRAVAARQASAERLRLAQEGFRKWQTEQARHDLDRARSVLKQSETVAAESEVRAPADGVILHRIAEPGLLAGPGQPVLTMAFANRLYVRTFIPETRLGVVRQGEPAEVTVDAYPGKRFPARITEISPDAEFTPKPVETRRERVNLVYAAKADLLAGWDARLVPGQPAEVLVTIPAPSGAK